MTVDLSRAEVGDIVTFTDGSVAAITRINDRSSGIYNLYFNCKVLGRTNKDTEWNYHSNGQWVTSENPDGCNHIIRVGPPGSLADPSTTVLHSPKVDAPIDTQNEAIRQVCMEMAEFLRGKNTSYNGAAFQDVVLGETTIKAKETILVRISDKIRRITSGKGFQGDNDFDDLLGYLILLKAVEKLTVEKL